MRSAPFAGSGHYGPPALAGGRIGLEIGRPVRAPGLPRARACEDGRGQPVLLIPGFLAGDDSLALMTRWLRRTGHHTSRAGMRRT